MKRDGWYRVHVCVKYEVPGVGVRAVRGIDLGVRRAMATVLLKPAQPLRRGDLSILRDGEKKHRLDMLSRRDAGLQRARKWEPLKPTKHKRRHVAEYYDRLDAIRIAQSAQMDGSMVALGYPKGIKYENYRGNGQGRLRRMLQQRFPYARRVKYLVQECMERGLEIEVVAEAWTSILCHRYSSVNTRRPSQVEFWCLDCGLRYNADWNAAINIGSVFLPAALRRRATVGLAYAGDELAQKPRTSLTLPRQHYEFSASLSFGLFENRS